MDLRRKILYALTLVRPLAEELTAIKELVDAFRKGSTSPVRFAELTLDRIDRLNPKLNCFITVLRDSALAAAEASERRFKEGKPIGPLDGVPIGIKDLIYIKGVRCTAGSKILASNIAPYDSPVTRRLKAAGAVIIGTTNMHEFAAGITSNNPHYGPVRNPWDSARVSGGSSGGSAAAVASGMVPAAIGTDTGGSVRIPAALCGILGLKPTYGRVSRLGVIPLASSFDTVGTLTSSVWDAASLLYALAGHEKDDVTTVDSPVPDYVTDLARPFEGARIGVPRHYFHDSIDPTVEEKFGVFSDRLREIGCTVEGAELDGIDDAKSFWVPIRRAEATAFHARWLESSPELYGDDVRRILEAGRSVTAVDYVRAINERPTLMERFANSMGDFDAFAVPTTAVTAPPIGANSVVIDGKEADTTATLLKLTFPFNVVGFPSFSVPADLAYGLPVGVQLVGRPFEESRLLRIAEALEARFGTFPSPPGIS